MTADEFAAALRELADADPATGHVREWGRIARRSRPAFSHPADPVLDLLARYDMTRITFWQLEFSDAKAPCFDGLWHVATKTTDAYYVMDGQLLHMYYKADYPAATGLSSDQLLDVLAVYARMVAEFPANPRGSHDPAFNDYARQAAAVSPHATELDWFWESSRR